jgi:F-type H+-transporting ATPase subunit gamma
MEQRATELQARRATVSAFGDLVNAMRAIAAARAQQARRLIAGVDTYATTVSAAMAQARGLLPADAGPRHDGGGATPLWVLIGGEQGFSGAYSEQLLAAVPEAIAGRVLLLGTQLLRVARARGCRPEWSAPTIAHADAAITTANTLHQALARALAQRRAGSVELVCTELGSAADGGEAPQIAVHRRRLLPLALPEVAETRGPPPLLHLPPARLLDDLAFEYVAAQLVRAVLHAHAAENLARLHAMAAAGENVERMVQTLKADERRLRQEAITAEIVELAMGLRGEQH